MKLITCTDVFIDERKRAISLPNAKSNKMSIEQTNGGNDDGHNDDDGSCHLDTTRTVQQSRSFVL